MKYELIQIDDDEIYLLPIPTLASEDPMDKADQRLLKLHNKLKAIQVQAKVKPACEMERPKLENFLPEDMTIDMVNNMFLENKELYNYINALDQYIDHLESKSV